MSREHQEQWEIRLVESTDAMLALARAPVLGLAWEEAPAAALALSRAPVLGLAWEEAPAAALALLEK